MVEIIGVKEFRKKISTLYLRTSKGDSFIVCRRSKPIFVVVPHEKDKQKKAKKELVKFGVKV